ncbi:hypothetical protein NLI96_g13186 [Meripilus lineatus]|uniref:Uncharacterized protein n=1 Tax=Meripilus lineatus TaxID=2056292 RepID=A0AAD5Y965_9APHY|nr:hypothetical protein NLI96_g13186 [Physisporinus lineatus]
MYNLCYHNEQLPNLSSSCLGLIYSPLVWILTVIPFCGDIFSTLVISQGPNPSAEEILSIGLVDLECLEGFTLLFEQHHIAEFGGIIKEDDPVSIALDSLGWKGTMNIREDEIKGKGVSVLCLLREGSPVLLAKDAWFTRTRHGCLRIKLEIDYKHVLQQGLQSVLGDVAQPSVQERSV